jgi:hypothetical protein
MPYLYEIYEVSLVLIHQQAEHHPQVQPSKVKVTLKSDYL